MKPLRNLKTKTRLLPDGHVAILNENNLWAHVLTPLGALVWELCDGQVDVDELVRSLAASIDRRVDATEVQALIDELLSMDLIIDNSEFRDPGEVEIGNDKIVGGIL